MNIINLENMKNYLESQKSDNTHIQLYIKVITLYLSLLIDTLKKKGNE